MKPKINCKQLRAPFFVNLYIMYKSMGQNALIEFENMPDWCTCV